MSKGSMKQAAFTLVGLVFATLFLVACEPRKTPIEKVHDRTGAPIEITVYTYQTQAELDRKYRELHGIARRDDNESRLGFARWPEWRNKDGESVNDGGRWTCEIHILEPRFIDDDRTLTLGHEMVHCIYGSYHE